MCDSGVFNKCIDDNFLDKLDKKTALFIRENCIRFHKRCCCCKTYQLFGKFRYEDIEYNKFKKCQEFFPFIEWDRVD